MTYAIRRGCEDSIQMVAAAAGLGGDVVTLPDGRLGVVQGAKPYAAGDTISVDCEPGHIYEFAAKTTDTFDASAGVYGYWDATNGEITSTTSGNTKLIRVTKDKTNGQTTVFGALIDQNS